MTLTQGDFDGLAPGHEVALATTVESVGGTVRLLGAIRFFDVGGTEVELRSAGQRRLLCALALGHGEVVRSEYLGEILGLASSALRSAVSRLRSLVGDAILTDGPGYRLDTELDSAIFQQLVDTTSMGAERLAKLDTALLLWHGEAIDEFSHESWVQAEAARLNELRLIATEDRAELLIATGRSDEAVADLEAHIAAHSLRDRPRGLLMQALTVAGRDAEALRTYQEYRAFLGEQTGTEPSTTVQSIEQRIAVGHATEQQEVIVALISAGYWSPDSLSQTRAGSPSTASSSRILPTGVVTFLFTDVEGSSAFWAADADAMAASLRVHDQLVRSTIEAHGGYVFSTAGDSFAAAFDRATDAVAAASQAQDLLASADWPGPALAVRMGAHIGETEERDGDYFGPVVNLAARLEASGHGGQTLVTESARAAAALQDSIVDLGNHRLKDVPEQVRIYQLGDTHFPNLRTVAERKTNLPPSRSSLIGREESIIQVQHALAESRLVTLTAVGGIGKTRLAIAVGEAELANRADGVWFVDLTALSSGTELAEAVANGVGLQLSAGDAAGQLIQYLSNKDALVIIDNCEHLVDDIADLMDAFLASPGSAHVLATSRELLDVEGEHAVPLRPLATDDVDSPAVRLFVERARASDPELAHADHLETIAAICGRLDGMPLAIELAAARVAVMSLDGVLTGLDNRFQLLSGGRRRQRQRTLEATLDWSYDLLSDKEQSVFRSLGVFLDGFDVDAVVAVADVSKPQAAELIEALLVKSMIVRSDRNDRVRFRLLETLKAYAEDRLVDASEASDRRDRHLDHFYTLSMRKGRTTCGGTLGMGRLLRSDVANLSAAAERAMSTSRLDIAAELLTASSMAYFLEIKLSELAGLMARVLTKNSEAGGATAAGFDDDLVGCLRSTTVWVNVFLANWEIVFIELDVLKRSPDTLHRALGSAIHAFLSARSSPDGVEALDSFAEAQLAEGAGEPERSNVATMARWMLADARANQALLTGQTQAVLDHSRENLGASIDVDDWGYSHVSVTVAAATAQIMLGCPTEALETIAWLSKLDMEYYDGTEILALAHLAAGDLDSAGTHVRAHATRGMSGRLHGEAADSLLLLAKLAHAEGDDALARRLLLDVGLARLHATNRVRELLAAELDIRDQSQALLERDVAPGGDRTKIAERTIAATKTELVRRCWI